MVATKSKTQAATGGNTHHDPCTLLCLPVEGAMSYIGLTGTSKTSIWFYFWLGLPCKSLLMLATLFQHLITVSLQQYLCQKHHSLSRDQEGKHTAVLKCTKRDTELVLQSANRISSFKHIWLSSNLFSTHALLGNLMTLFVDKISHQSLHIHL